MITDQMRQDFGVSAGMEGVACLEQSFFEPIVILDDTVVDDGNFPRLIQMRVGIFVGGRSVGGPACMADAQRAYDGLLPYLGNEALIDLALFLPDMEIRSVEDSDAGAVVAAVLEATQPFEEDWTGGFLTHVTNNAAHSDYRTTRRRED